MLPIYPKREKDQGKNMDYDIHNNLSENIIDCHVKDQAGLNDFQKLPSQSNLAIDQVGISRYRFPILVESNSQLITKDALAKMSISLPEGKTGVNMSRLVQILQAEALEKPMNFSLMNTIVDRFQKELRDELTDPLFEKCELLIQYQHQRKQTSLKSHLWGWQYYPLTLKVNRVKEKTICSMTMNYEYSSTCPCSLSMAKQYEREFREGLTAEGNGIATAHSQRSLAIVEIFFTQENPVSIDELYLLLAAALPTETQSMVKRLDEQAFAILNGENPMFVEHAARNISTQLDTDSRIIDWSAEVEHFESLHSHNAQAKITKKLPC